MTLSRAISAYLVTASCLLWVGARAHGQESGGLRTSGSTGGAVERSSGVVPERSSGLERKPPPPPPPPAKGIQNVVGVGPRGNVIVLSRSTRIPSPGLGVYDKPMEMPRPLQKPMRLSELPGTVAQPETAAGPRADATYGHVSSKKDGEGWNKVTVTSPLGYQRTYEVSDRQMHLFETAKQTQARMESAKSALSRGDASQMQKVTADVMDQSAFWAKQAPPMLSAPRRLGPASGFGTVTSSGDADPRLTEDPKELAAASELAALTGLERSAELVKRGDANGAREYLGDYLTHAPEDGRALLVYGLQELAARNDDRGLIALARVCELGSGPWSEKINLPSFGISETEIANALSRLNTKRTAQKGMKEALGLAVASHMAGRDAAANKLLEQAVALGYDKAEAGLLMGYWKPRK